MTGRVPVSIVSTGWDRWKRHQRVLLNARKAGLVKRQDIKRRALVLLNDAVRLNVRVERVHQNERDTGEVFLVEMLRARCLERNIAHMHSIQSTYLDLLHSQVEERQTVSDFNGTLWANATHRRSKPTVEFHNREFVQDI